ncbi:MAG TPA: hypothetical protein VIM11_01525 [Tepidisphaeraceae bacterium]|jgi:stress-induced morphogen
MTQQEAESLADALRGHFEADVDMELVNDRGRYRFAVVSKQFQSMNDLERQDEVWKIVDRTMPRAATLDISLILAFAPEELADSGA